MKTMEIDRLRNRLLDLRDRLDGAIVRMSEVVLTDDQPLGEHDRKVSEDSEKECILEQSEESLRDEVSLALQRIEDGSYGFCVECGHAIGAQRLAAMPYVSFCLRCQRKLEAF